MQGNISILTDTGISLVSPPCMKLKGYIISYGRPHI